MKGLWCVRYGDALAWLETPSEAAAVRRSLNLHRLGDWTDDARQLAVFPQDAYPENAGSLDYTRVVMRAAGPHVLSSRSPRSRNVRLVRGIPCVRPHAQLLEAQGVCHRTGRSGSAS